MRISTILSGSPLHAGPDLTLTILGALLLPLSVLGAATLLFGFVF